ncbi:MAG: flagellar protein FlgN [Thermoanaerobacteraceae bacterium]|nr:flagellar protein FlgN [Thermoanaerobacteraceae bacterium]
MNMHELLSILEREFQVYKNLYELGLKKKEVLIKGKVNELDEIVNAEQACIAAVSKLEDEREKWLKNYSMTGMEDVHDAIENSADDEKGKFVEFQERFKKLLQDVAEVNEHNQALIEQALEYIEFSINLIGDAITSDKATYDNKGTYKKSSALFDEKI